MPGPTKFQDAWLKRRDSNNVEVGSYIKLYSGSIYISYCIICERKISTKAGFSKIDDHSTTKIHLKNVFKLKKSQLRLQATENKTGASKSSTSLTKKVSTLRSK